MQENSSLDLLDKRIVRLLYQTPDITQSKMAEELGVSQPWVATRINHLKQRGVLSSSVSLNIRRLGLVSCVVRLTAKDPYHILDKYRKCPCFLTGLVLADGKNVSLVFCAEDVPSLEGIVDQCIRKEPDVDNVELGLVTYSLGSNNVCPELVTMKSEMSPCGVRCSICPQFQHGNCLACPASVCYKGRFWNENNRHNHMEVMA